MSTLCQPCTCAPLPLRNTNSSIKRWTRAVVRYWQALWTSHRTHHLDESQLSALDGLSAETLKDIGAPEWLQEQTQRAHDRAWQGGLLERDSLHWR